MFVRLPRARPDRPVLLHRRRTSTGRTVSRFYGYTLEDTGRAARGSSTPTWSTATSSRPTARSTTPPGSARSPSPTLMIAGDGDIMSDVPSTELTFAGPGQPRQDLDAVRQGRGPRRRLRPLRPRLEPLRPQGDLPPADRLARRRQPVAARPRRRHRHRPRRAGAASRRRRRDLRERARLLRGKLIVSFSDSAFLGRNRRKAIPLEFSEAGRSRRDHSGTTEGLGASTLSPW